MICRKKSAVKKMVHLLENDAPPQKNGVNFVSRKESILFYRDADSFYLILSELKKKKITVFDFKLQNGERKIKENWFEPGRIRTHNTATMNGTFYH